MISIKNLNKSYGKKIILDDISFKFNSGVLGLLGENGAGKTTLLKILATLIPYEAEEAKIFNYDLQKDGVNIRRLLGYLPQHFDFFSNTTVYDAMDYFARLKGIKTLLHKKQELNHNENCITLVL